MMAFVRGVMASLTFFTSRQKVFGSTSTMMGVALTLSTAVAGATQHRPGTMTSSPGPMSSDSSAISSAAEPFVHATACLAPLNAAHFSVNTRSCAGAPEYTPAIDQRWLSSTPCSAFVVSGVCTGHFGQVSFRRIGVPPFNASIQVPPKRVRVSRLRQQRGGAQGSPSCLVPDRVHEPITAGDAAGLLRDEEGDEVRDLFGLGEAAQLERLAD